MSQNGPTAGWGASGEEEESTHGVDAEGGRESVDCSWSNDPWECFGQIDGSNQSTTTYAHRIGNPSKHHK